MGPSTHALLDPIAAEERPLGLMSHSGFFKGATHNATLGHACLQSQRLPVEHTMWLSYADCPCVLAFGALC